MDGSKRCGNTLHHILADTELRTAAGLVRTINGDLTATNEGRPCGLHVKFTVPAKTLQPVLI
jgi:hypothetical protein